MACVEVRDQGIGISPANQQRIFQQFERVASNHSVAGLGLGLYISEQIVLAHEGRITVHSAEGEGATFRVYLPLVCDMHERKNESGRSEATSV